MRLPLAITGRLPLLLLAGVGPVVVRPGLDTVGWWTLLVLLAAGLDVALAAAPDRLRFERDATAPTRLGETTATHLRVEHGGRRRARGVLRDAWQPTAGATGERHRLDLRPGDGVRLTTALTPVRRGDLRAAGVTVRLRGPLGLAARQRTLPVEGRVRALPAFPSRVALPSRLARLRDLDGRAAVRVRGLGTEFDSLREYVPGDDVRSIDWRATGRSRRAVVRTWQPERDRRVVLVVDTSRTSAARVEDVPRLDAALDAALFLAALATRAGDRVDLVAGDRRVRARARLGAARDAVHRLDDLLAGLDPVLAEADWPTLAGAVADLGRNRALLVLLTTLDAAPLEEGLLPLLPALTARHRVLLATVGEPELARLAARTDTAGEVYAAAAAAQAAARRSETAALLRGLGVEVVDAAPDGLAVALGDHYLALKAAGRL
ncbi:DUF58 domain-containing protein [Nocardioides fonticola]|uniref:DUF58 domain-containing protein n=1 Tax=Nocardioides fonticola TaxID=450363 RepID=A0ABP7XJD3_9ACTN